MVEAMFKPRRANNHQRAPERCFPEREGHSLTEGAPPINVPPEVRRLRRSFRRK